MVLLLVILGGTFPSADEGGLGAITPSSLMFYSLKGELGESGLLFYKGWGFSYFICLCFSILNEFN